MVDLARVQAKRHGSGLKPEEYLLYFENLNPLSNAYIGQIGHFWTNTR
jgi:hypothetical protein